MVSSHPTICGHAFNRKFLDGQVSNLTAQSFVFVGPEKVGRRLIALEFAQKIMCQDLTKDEACGNCPSCLSLAKKLNPDLFEISFAGDTGDNETITDDDSEETVGADDNIVAPKKLAETKEIKVEQIKPLLDFLQYKPQLSRKRVVIVDNAERLNIEAWSYLLKTIEEPPPDSILIFLVTDIKRLPDTITSRLLKLDFTEIPLVEINKWLEKNFNNNQDLTEIAWRSHGLPGMALDLIANQEKLQWYRQTDKEFLELLTMPFCKQSPFLDKLAKLNSADIETTLLEWLFLLKYYLEERPHQFSFKGPPPKLTQKNLAVMAGDLSSFLDWNRRSGINKRLWLENIFLRQN